MDQYGKTIRIGAMVLACAVVLRLGATGFFDPVVELLTSRSAAAVLLFLETGHILRSSPPSAQDPTAGTDGVIDPEPTQTVGVDVVAPDATQPPETTEVTQPPQSITVFSPSDAELVQVHSYCGYDADVKTWLEQPLDWDLTQEAPTVLIVHSHATESYENTEDYRESSAYRTLDQNYNVVSVGDALVQLLEIGGVKALHDRQLHDHPSYSDAYGNSRASVQAYLDQYPSIRLVLDLHRDAVENDDGQQLKYTVQTGSGPAAQLMLVVGTDAGGLSHAKWPENMSLAVKFHAQLEKLCPGICRPISFRTQRFNQDLSTGALLVEIGAAGNTRQEALTAVQYLAQSIIDLAHGTQ